MSLKRSGIVSEVKSGEWQRIYGEISGEMTFSAGEGSKDAEVKLLHLSP